MDGKFFTSQWGNSTSDIDVRTLLHGYRLVSWDREFGMFRENSSVVNGILITENEDDDTRDYLLSLYSDLYFSDETPITAWDYAFSVLFQSNPIVKELDGVPLNAEYLLGYEDYVGGRTPYLAGVRVLSDTMIEFRVKRESLPFFFEFFRFAYEPYPIREIAPGCRVYDDGLGCYIDNEDQTSPVKVFSKELLEKTVMDPKAGYMSHPAVVSGPYVMTGWDGETCIFVFFHSFVQLFQNFNLTFN